MKIDKQLPVAAGLDPHARPQPQPQRTDTPVARPAPQGRTPESRTAEQYPNVKETGFTLQLNQQLSSMQSAEQYLSELASRLAALKLNISRRLSSPQAANERESIERTLQQVNTLLEQRSKRSGESLDATLKLRLNEPLRNRFSVQGLGSVEAIQRSGKETLLFSAGRSLPEPVAVVLEDGMSEEQILRRFNSSLGQAGIRTELSAEGTLKFSVPEQSWQILKEQLRVQGEGKLFPKGAFNPVTSHADGLPPFSIDLEQDSARELRQLLDSVVATLDRVGKLREQLSQRQADVREFLARQENLDEQQWALSFASVVFNRHARTSVSYATQSQTVVAQAQLTRFAVVSLLS
jgi:hypothetical protein